MSELTQAYELLTAYTENVQRSKGAEENHLRTSAPPHLCTFSREAVEKTLLIAIRRQDVPA
jgi:hypothetical protein